MTSFSKVWAVKSDKPVNLGDTVSVALKRGGTKQVEVGAFLYEKDEYFYYASPLKVANPD